MLTFTTPILKKQHPDADALNKRLEDILLEQESNNSGTFYSNIGGWHSSSDLWEWPREEIKILKQFIQENFQRMLAFSTKQPVAKCDYHTEAWAVINRAGHVNLMHIHPGCHWSGVYYVTTDFQPGTEREGTIVFFDPRAGAAMMSTPQSTLSQEMFIKPQSGLLIIYPSWLVHSVLPFLGEGLRIAISFNITIQNLVLKK